MKMFWGCIGLLWLSLACGASGAWAQPWPPSDWRGARADYAAAPRLPNGHVDVDTLVARLKELGVTTYYWLIHGRESEPADWEDLQLFLPRAAAAGMDVWVYLLPPTEPPPSAPFGLDYMRWAEEIARLSLRYPNLTGWVIDDFYFSLDLYTPEYVQKMQTRAKSINPHLRFYPLMYYDEIRPEIVDEYRRVVDGMVVAYPQDEEDILQAWGVLNDSPVFRAEMSYPLNTQSHAGDFVLAGQPVQVISPDRCVVHFQERDDFLGETAGYHFKQLLVDGNVAWEADVAGGTPAWHEVTVDVTPYTHGKRPVTLAFRLYDKRGVSNFSVCWRLRDLRLEGLRAAADLSTPARWQVQQRGAFATGFGHAPVAGRRRFHVPFIVMTAAQTEEFKLRHGPPATPERMAEWLRLALQAWREGRCDGVVTYCLDVSSDSRFFGLAGELFHDAAKGREK